MEPNPSRTLGDVEAQTELAIVQVVPEAAAQEFAVEAGEAVDRPRKVSSPEYFIFMGSFGQEIAFLKQIRANWPDEPKRLVACDA